MLVSMRFSEAQEKAKVEHASMVKKKGREIQNLKEIIMLPNHIMFHKVSMLFHSPCPKFKFLIPLTVKYFYFTISIPL